MVLMSESITYSKAMEKFQHHLLVERGYSKLTVKEYLNDLKLFKEYLQEKENYPNDFSVERVEKYEIVDFLGNIIIIKENTPATRNRKLYSLRSFFKYLVQEKILSNNPAETVEASKTENRSEPIYLKTNDARKYIRTIRNSDSRNNIRDLAIVKLFLYAGLRISELVNLDMENLDFDDEALKFYGKGNKERVIPLHNDVIEAILDYLPLRDQVDIKKEEDKNALFLSSQGKRISPRTIQLFVKKYAREAGLRQASKITPHKLRHTFATSLYHQTKDIKVLQDLLGHADISTTQIYTHTDLEEKQQAIDELPGMED